MRDLAVLVHVGKTGSSTARRLFLDAARLPEAGNGSRDPWATWLCGMGLNGTLWKTEAVCARSDIANGPRSTWGDGDIRRPGTRARRGIRMITTLREPIARIVSEYAFFCLGCGDYRQFCGKFVHTGCGTRARPSFVQWAARAPNQYVRQFSRHWPQRTHFRALAHGFPGAPEIDQYAVMRAYRALSDPSTLVLWTEDMSRDGPRQLSRVRAWLGNDTNAASALRNVSAFPHINSRPHHRGYKISAAQRRAACAANWADCALYELLRGRPCAC